MNLCPFCLGHGYCRKLTTDMVTDAELADPGFIRDLRNFAFGLPLSCYDWLDGLNDLYRDYPGRIIGPDGGEVLLDMEQFERPNICYWFREFCCTPCPPDITPRVRKEARNRVRVLATILRACFPADAQFWGLRADNDNQPRRLGPIASD